MARKKAPHPAHPGQYTNERQRRPNLASGAHLPAVAVIEIADVDFDGEMVARPVGWRGAGAAPRIVVVAEPRTPALGRGERAVARLAYGAAAAPGKRRKGRK